MHKTKQHIIRFILPLLVVFLIGTIPLNGATKIRNAIFHEYNDTSYLILHLYNFRPLGGSYEKGNERVSGYDESEIQIYNLETRKLVAQKNYGPNNDESALEILGCSDSLLWIYSLEYKSGLQGVSIYSLNKEISQAKIYKNLSEWHGRFIDPPWNEIQNYYGFNQIRKSLLVTNYLNKPYSIEYENFKIIQLPEDNKINTTNNESVSRIIYSDKDTLNIFNNALHKNNIQLLPNKSFIEGSFIVEQNKQKLYSDYSKLLLFYTDILKNANDMLSRVRAKKDSKTYNELLANKIWYKEKVRQTKENLNTIKNNKKPDKLLLTSKDNSFYILHRTNEDRESFISISKILNNNNKLSVKWETIISGIFFDLQMARDTKVFKRHFGDFVPENTKMYVQDINNSLIIVYQMRVFSVNSLTGEINWRIKL